MPFFDNYITPLTDPKEMNDFLVEADVYINIDTTHYAQCNIELSDAASHLKDRVKTIHISDFHDGKPHVYIGDGILDFERFAKQLNLNSLHAVTIECGIPAGNEGYDYIIEKYKEAKYKTDSIFLKKG